MYIYFLLTNLLFFDAFMFLNCYLFFLLHLDKPFFYCERNKKIPEIYYFFTFIYLSNNCLYILTYI